MHLRTLALLPLVVGAALASAQPATPAQMAGVKAQSGYGTMHFRTRLGSFKIIDGQGRVEISFTGTILASQLKGGALVVTGQVRKEYEGHDRVVYTGKGHVVLTGQWRAFQWFGRDLDGVWYGAGVIRLAGEFDREQRTGEFWFEDPKDVQFWPGSSTFDIVNPPNRPGQNPNVTVKKKG